MKDTKEDDRDMFILVLAPVSLGFMNLLWLNSGRFGIRFNSMWGLAIALVVGVSLVLIWDNGLAEKPLVNYLKFWRPRK